MTMVCFQKVIILLMTLRLVVSEEKVDSDNLYVQLTESQSRALKQEWRAVEEDKPHFFPEWNEETSPLEENTSPRIIKRRRRIRKRKRRPQNEQAQELDFDSLMTIEPIRRKVRPHRLDEIDDSWINISEEMMDQPHHRRRTSPTFESGSSEDASRKKDDLSFERFGPDDALDVKLTSPSPKFYEKVRDPFTALEEDDKIKKRRKGAPDIKNILKKTGSVSEVLQKKNLSLTDLLMGKEQAISALTDSSTIDGQPVKEYKNPVRDDFSWNHTELTKKKAENIDSLHERKKLHRFGQKSTTELYLHITEQKHEILNTTTVIPYVTNAQKTNSDSNNYIKKKFKGTIVGNSNDQHQVQKTTTASKDLYDEGPVRMSLNVNNLAKIKDDTKETDTELPQKLRPFSAKEEIMEMMKDPEGNRRLSRILELKNITLDELIEMRERGSSKKHLADLFHNQNKEPEPPKEPFIGHIRTSAKRGSLTLAKRKPKALEDETEMSLQNSTAIVLSSFEKEVNTADSYTTTTFPMIRINKNISSSQEVENNKILWTNILSKADAIGDIENDSLLISKKIEDILENDVRRIDDLGDKLSDAFNDQLQMEFDEGPAEKRNDSNTVQNGIASAILASLSVVGVSLFVFLTILFVFKLSRRKKNRRSLLNHFSEYKSKYPILGGSLRKTFTLSVPEKFPPKKVRDPVSFIKQVPENEDRKPYESVACY
ncbi:uncharacterized protein LOC108742731 [Agrilus planipennis]|uniref:Uncharacterized protein LOC108742731 n=1 Tax=Agrilus planipennis TaxID=224129 RepID=A0A1W4XBY2_AGRPL|nr:uncharacterized protein LOC108742731 [Agrilus planipennis]